ncbi:MAG: hypothetical protein WKF78_06760 [Candidatus Limnocylindrales bacterium]
MLLIKRPRPQVDIEVAVVRYSVSVVAVEYARPDRWEMRVAILDPIVSKSRRAAVAALVGVLALIGGQVATASAAPVVTRSHLDFAVRIDDCGIGTVQLSADVVSVVNDSPHGTTYVSAYAGTAVDLATGTTYRFVDVHTQSVTDSGEPSINTAQGTIIFTSPTGGLVARGLVHTTIRPDGTVSGAEIHFVRCR